MNATVNQSAITVMAKRMAAIAIKRLAARDGYSWMLIDPGWLDFLTKLFEQLLPILIGCMGSSSLGELKRPRRATEARLRMQIRWSLDNRDDIREFAEPIFDAAVEAAATATEAEVNAAIAT